MKKTLKVSLSGMVFQIEEDAYEQLEKYLDQLKDRFRGIEGETEILNDIEIRLAELFQQRMESENQSVNLEDVEYATGILGEPEVIGEMAEEDREEEPDDIPPPRGARRMYRDPDGRIIGGVSSGLGEYLNIDPVIIRILFVVFTLTYGVGFLIYLLLWIAIPEARTRAEKMEMRGEYINIANIERSVRREYDAMKDRRQKRRENREKRSSQSRPESRPPREPRPPRPPRAREHNHGFGYVIGQIFVTFFKIIGAIIGFSFVVAGVALLVLIIGAFVARGFWIDDFGWNLYGFTPLEFMDLFVDESIAIIVMICLIVLIAVPTLGLVYGGVKLLFRFRANDRAVAVSSVTAWVVALLVVVVIGITEAAKYSQTGRIETVEVLDLPDSQFLYMQAGAEPDNLWSESVHFGGYPDFWITESRGKLQLSGQPRIDIIRSRDQEARMEITRKARGTNSRVARDQAEEIEYSFTLRDTLFTFDPVFTIPVNGTFRAQEIDIDLYLPEGTRIYLDRSLRNMIYSIDNTEDRWTRQMVGDTWIMTDEGLSLVNR